MTLIRELQSFHQLVWLDSIHRNLITSGELHKLVAEGISGATTRPAAFRDAVQRDQGYMESMRDLVAATPDLDVRQIYERLILEDVRMAADVLRPVYDASHGSDGFVTLDISPELANDAQNGIAEAHRLYGEVGRHNVMITLPATPEGTQALQSLIAHDVPASINSIFSLAQYECAAEAYLKGLQESRDPARVCSVAAISIAELDHRVDSTLADVETTSILPLRGKIATATAKLAYRRFRELFFGAEFEIQKRRGAHIQSPLWVDTGSRASDPTDFSRMQNLIGPDTIHSISVESVHIPRELGSGVEKLEQGRKEAEDVLGALERMEISLHSIAQTLLDECIVAARRAREETQVLLEKLRHQILAGRAA